MILSFEVCTNTLQLLNEINNANDRKIQAGSLVINQVLKLIDSCAQDRKDI